MAVWILSSCVVILIVLFLRTVFRKWISPSVRYALWLLVLVRLLLPFSVGETILSAEHLYRELPKWSTQIEETLMYDPSDTDTAEPGTYVSEGNPYQNISERISENKKADIIRVLRLLWVIGCAAAGVIVLISNLHFYHRLRRSRRKLDVTDVRITVYETDAVTSPCLYGFPRPSIYLTKETAENDALRNYVIAHESTHYRTGDHLWAFLRCVCLTLHWYNPLVWLAADMSRQDAEQACDAGTVHRLGEEQRFEYGKALLALASSESAKRKSGLFSAAAGAVSQSKSQISGRIHTLVQNRTTKIAAAVLLIPVIVTAAVVGYTGIRTNRIAGAVQAPEYVREAALVWQDEMIADTKATIQQIFESSDNNARALLLERFTTTDWQITELTPLGMTAPVCGREIEIWAMERQEYAAFTRGWNWTHWDYQMDGSGWTTYKDTYYLVFDAETKEELRRYRNHSEEAAQDTGELFDRICESVRFFEQTGISGNDQPKKIAGRNLRSLFFRLSGVSGEFETPYFYEDRICYKLELVSEGTGKYGREEIWRVIVNETGEEAGRFIYYPEHGDMAILDNNA